MPPFAVTIISGLGVKMVMIMPAAIIGIAASLILLCHKHNHTMPAHIKIKAMSGIMPLNMEDPGRPEVNSAALIIRVMP